MQLSTLQPPTDLAEEPTSIATRMRLVNAPAPTHLLTRPERLIAGAGIIDQAVLGFVILGQRGRIDDIPRSMILDIADISRQFRQPKRLIEQAKLIASAGLCAARLARGWRKVLTDARRPIVGTRRAAHYYTIASLAAASFVTAWLMLRKVQSSGQNEL